jgi:uncharacterized protein
VTQADDEVLTAPLVIEYPFSRTTGSVVGAFMTALREGFLVGIRGVDGRVIVPPTEYDPTTGDDLTEVVEVGPAGTVTTWTWEASPLAKHPLQQPFAWALIRPDGADTAMLGAVAVASPDAISSGLRVEPVWADEREGSIHDLAHWKPEEA